MLPSPQRASDLLSRLLDRNYLRAAEVVTRAIAANSNSGLMAQRLRDLDAEAARLVQAGERLTASNPVVRALLADFDTTMRANAALVNGAGATMQELGVQAANQITFNLSTGLTNPAQLARLGITWNTPDPEALARIVEYTDSGAWAQQLARYGDGLVQTVQDIAVRGVAMGQGPRTIAQALRAAVTTMPAAQANTLMRTLQLTSYRDATAATHAANADILEPYAIRIATLDGRTCMGCVGLHGSRIPIGERVDDHDQGRCTSVAPLRGREINVRSGEAWFRSLPEARQRQQMGGAMYEAWRAGAIRIADIPQRRTDPVFGGQVIAASLKGMLGDRAQQYYARNRQSG